MKRPSDLSVEQIKNLSPQRLKAYRNKLLDYHREADDDSIGWVKGKIAEVQGVIKGNK